LSSVLLETKNAQLARQSVVYNIDPVKLSAVFPEIKCLYLFAAHHDVQMNFIWKPRESPEMLIADQLSREEGNSEIFIKF